MFQVPERFREINGAFKTDKSYGNHGLFIIPLRKGKAEVIASDGWGWEHVSVKMNRHGKIETPTWEEMCMIKDLFWSEEDCVIQYHPPHSQYVNNHPNVLHLWRKSGVDFELPNPLMVGIPLCK